MHVFLTGNIQVGKTTIIKNILTRTGLSADGFVTYWQSGSDGRCLYLSPYSADYQAVEKYLLAQEREKRFVKAENITEVFDGHGADILNACGNNDLTVMDELGFLESCAESFQKAVMRRLAGNVPVLGVIRQVQTEFLDAVRTHQNVKIFDVTKENREDVLSALLSIFGGL